MKVKITTNIQMAFWLLITFLVFIFLPEKWVLNHDQLKSFFSFIESVLPGISKLASKSTYPETMRVLFSVMWVTVPLQIPGYIYAEYIRMKKKNINVHFLASLFMFTIALGIFSWAGLGVGGTGLHQNEGPMGELANLLYTNILGVIIHVYIVTAVFSLTLALTIVQLLFLNHKNILKEK